MAYNYTNIPRGKYKMVKQETKQWYQSKSLWVGVLTTMAGVATSVAASVTAGVPLTIVGLINIILRIVTKSEIVSNK